MRRRPGPPASDRPAPRAARDEALATAVAEARDEIARTDAKAGILLTLATGAVAGLVTFVRAGHVPLAAAVPLWLAAALAAAAVGLLLAVVRPRLGKCRPGGGFPDHERLLEGPAVPPGWHADRLALLSALAVAKHRRLARAVDVLYAALALLAGAVLVTGSAS